MGLLSGLLLFPVAGPVWGFRLFAERLRDEAEASLYDEGRGYAELLDLSMRRNAGKISESEYAEAEAELLDRLGAIRDSRDELLEPELEDGESAAADVGADWGVEPEMIEAEP